MRTRLALAPLSLLLFAALGCSSSGDAEPSGTARSDAGDAGAEAGADSDSDAQPLDGSWPDVATDGDASSVPDGPDGSGDPDAKDDASPDAAAPHIQVVTLPVGGVSARWQYEDAYDNVAGGDWYRDSDNETATLAWGESYVMMSILAMFRATGSPLYLERLAWHADGVLANRDDHRGVSDYRGISTACWQDRHYQTNNEPYCYVVHSGMLGYPLAEFARLVERFGLEEELAYDGETFGAKAAAYVQAAEETVAAHDDQWKSGGYYVFRPDASFMAYPGKDLPLNQSNAMGRMLLALHAVTGNGAYLDKATKLAQRFKAQLTTGASGEYLWNYWGGAYASPGEDISHAAINVDFAAMAAEQGVVFDDADLEAFARTFMGPVYVDDGTLSDHVGGGSTNGTSYRPQAGGWLRLATKRTAIYAAIRDLYEHDYGPSGLGSGSVLHGWAYLAEFEPTHRDHFFYSVDWEDQGDWREATAYGANILTTPADLTAPSVALVTVDVPRPTDVGQWDGSAYHTLLTLRATGGSAVRWLPYETRWPFVYWNDGVLYQFEDTFVSGAGIRVKESAGYELPSIAYTAPTQGATGTPIDYAPTGTGSEPRWWALARFPVGARIDHATGAVTWTPFEPGAYPFTVRLQNDYGFVDQEFTINVP